MILSVVASILAGVLCGTLGYYVERLGVVTLCFSVAHAALAGAALAMILGTDMTLTAASFSVCLAFLMGLALRSLTRMRELASMAFFSAFNAIALLMIYISNTTVLATASISSVLWGSVLVTTPLKLAIMISVLAAFLLYTTSFKEQLEAILFDKKLAEAEGIDVRVHILAILLFVGAAIALTLKLTGGFLVFSLLYNPMAASMVVSKRANIQMILSPIIGSSSSLSGLMLSYLLDWPVGACITVSSVIVLAVAAVSRYAANSLLARRAASEQPEPEMGPLRAPR